jgi:hypothetical protein
VRGIEVEIHPGLQLRYVVDGQFTAPPPTGPRFADGLWQHTCFEVFVARKGMPGYREFNFSPSGEWAAYAFASNRQGMARLALAPRIAFREKTLEAEIPLEPGALRIGLSAVMEEADGTLSYWALKHAPGKPDFHHPDAFALEIG